MAGRKQLQLKKIFLFGGLGADQRVLDRLEFPGYETEFVDWLPPIKNETIQKHASRLADEISDSDPILLGLSFGGMLAIEIAKQIRCRKLILISSVKTRNEMPFYLKISGKLGLHHLLPGWLLKKPNFISYWFFGVKSPTGKLLLAKILRQTDTVYLKWAVNQIVNWNNETIPATIFHLHGSSDRILPARFVKADNVIQGGGHLMVIDHTTEINSILKKLLFTLGSNTNSGLDQSRRYI